MILEFPLKKISKNNRVGKAIRHNLGEEIPDSFTIEAGLSLLLENNTWTMPFMCKVDTGAFMTLLPQFAFDQLKPKKFTPYQLYGVVNKQECLLNCKLSKVKARLHSPADKKSPEFEIWVAFSESDDVPLLLGMLGILDKYKSILDPLTKKWSVIFH